MSETKKVTLIKAGHEHKGKACKVGDKIEVDAAQEAFLQQAGLIEAPADTTAAKAAKPEAK